jgi:phosphatidylglycerophosphatase C
VPAPTPERPAVAAFDVDGTLTTGDCVLPFLRRAAGRRLLTTPLAHPRALAGALFRRDRDRLKELACSGLGGLTSAETARLGDAFARDVASGRLRADTTARLRRHRELGHTVLLASASLDAYLLPLGALLGVDDIVCTQLERDADGRLTGRLDGANCRGPEKARRGRALRAARGREAAELWAYGDSPADADFLSLADHPVRIGRARIAPDPATR